MTVSAHPSQHVVFVLRMKMNDALLTLVFFSDCSVIEKLTSDDACFFFNKKNRYFLVNFIFLFCIRIYIFVIFLLEEDIFPRLIFQFNIIKVF